MKDLLNILKYSLFLSLIVTLVSCGGDDGGDDGGDGGDDALQTIADNLTRGRATFSAVSKPDGASDLDWDGMTITFTGGVDGGDYTTNGSPNTTVWPASGDWEFKSGSDGKFIVRDGDTDVAVSVGTTEMVLTFDVNTSTTGRTKVIDGEWEFTFTF